MRRAVLGTAGHIDHGKTALVHALTGTDTDRLPEEKRRGITIDLGFAQLELDHGVLLAIVDVPGHEAFVRNMLAGASGIDLVMLVIAADEGVMPQTREHLAIIELLGIHCGVVALTKVDLVDDEWLELVREDVAGLLARSSLADAPVLPVSSRTGAGLEGLRAALGRVAAAAAARPTRDLFRMPIDRVFTVHGTGTVVTGTVWSGSVRRDEQVSIAPSGLSARVRTLQQHGLETGSVEAGARAAVALTGVHRHDTRRGETLVSDSAWTPSSMLTVELHVLHDAPAPVRPRQRVRAHIGTAEVMARVALIAEPIEPGGHDIVQLRLESPVIARAGDRFVIRSYSPVHTIAGGTVLEPVPPKRKRLAPADREALTMLRSPGSALEGATQLAGAAGIELSALTVRAGLAPADVSAAVESSGTLLRDGPRVVRAGPLHACRQAVIDATAAFHAGYPLDDGLDREQLRRGMDRELQPLLETAITALAAEGAIAFVGHAIALAGHQPEPSAEQQVAIESVLAAYAAAALQPPDLDELPADLRDRPDLLLLLRHLEREGRLVRLTPSRWCDAATIAAAVVSLRSALPPSEPQPLAVYRQVLGASRKHLIPLLEFFDRTGVTRRHGDTRSVIAE
jgi:selenocysteine-specific elongation factor